MLLLISFSSNFVYFGRFVHTNSNMKKDITKTLKPCSNKTLKSALKIESCLTFFAICYEFASAIGIGESLQPNDFAILITTKSEAASGVTQEMIS